MASTRGDEQAKRLIDQQAAQAIAAVETRERQLTLQRQQQELVQRGAPQFLSALGGPLPGGAGDCFVIAA